MTLHPFLYAGVDKGNEQRRKVGFHADEGQGFDSGAESQAMRLSIRFNLVMTGFGQGSGFSSGYCHTGFDCLSCLFTSEERPFMTAVPSIQIWIFVNQWEKSG